MPLMEAAEPRLLDDLNQVALRALKLTFTLSKARVFPSLRQLRAKVRTIALCEFLIRCNYLHRFFSFSSPYLLTLRGSENPKKDSSAKRRGGDGKKKENRLPMLEPPPTRRVALRQPNNRIIIQDIVNIRLQQARDHNVAFLSILLGILLRNPHGTPHWHKQAPTVPRDRRKRPTLKTSKARVSSRPLFSLSPNKARPAPLPPCTKRVSKA